jgi:hypothetical protein
MFIYTISACAQEQREALEGCIDDDSYVYEALEKVHATIELDVNAL